MSFDYDKIIKDLTKGVTIYSMEGRYQVQHILEYLRECPFIEVVAEQVGATDVSIYNKLRYHLKPDVVNALYVDLKERRNVAMNVLRDAYKRRLEELDASRKEQKEQV